MRQLNHGIKWILAAVLLAGITAVPAMAEKTTPATDKNSAVPAVPRAIPDLIPYTKFDPPTSKLFDINKLTISGDLRVRPEFRNNTTFGARKANTFFVQQWVRLGFNYSISPDVTFFFQPQYSKNWGVNNGPVDAVATGGTIFARQAFMLVRNFLVPNLTIKAGRQLVVWGNHRMFGHFDWNNVGWAHDGITTNYKLSQNADLQVGWLRTQDLGDCPSPTSGGCINTADPNDDNPVRSLGKATNDSDIIFVRAPMKVAGMVLEPTYIWQGGGTGAPGGSGPRPSDQARSTVGGRAVKKFNAGSARVDATVEGYYQFGEIGDGTQTGRNLDISAYAFHIDGGVTLPVPMQPRLGAEFNTASGDSDPNDGDFEGFDQLYPTNHIHFGYMDRMAWKNMNHYAFGLQLRPTKASHLEVTGHMFSLKEEQDGWYHAGQGAIIAGNANNTESDIGQEIDVVYTHFFTQGNHVAWQIGGGVFLPGDYLDSQRNGDASEQTWGYTQLWVNF